MIEWFYTSGGVRMGPVSENEFHALAASGAIANNSHVWAKGMPNWQRYGDLIKRGAFFSALDEDGQDLGVATWLFYCAECGRPYPGEDLISYASVRVCAACKPVFFQRLHEGVKLPGYVEYASFWTRFAAKFLDQMVIGMGFMAVYMVFIVLMVAGVAAFGDLDSGAPGGASFAFIMIFYAVILVMSFVGPIAYNTWFIGRFAATPGKMAMGILVVRSDGSSVTYLRAMARAAAEIINQFIFYIGYLMAAFDGENRTLHDHICDTRVIKK